VPDSSRLVKTAVVSSTNPSHQSARVGASIHSRWVPTLRIDSGDDLGTTVTRLNAWQPEMLIAYASMVRLLAEAQLAGHLMIMPRFVFSASEVLTDSTRRLATTTRGRSPTTSMRQPRRRGSLRSAASMLGCTCSRTW
jgi:phenylacetate-CoA ligase